VLNWLTRYAPVAAELDFDTDGRLLESVLDVGCGPHGLATVAPGAVFVGVDLEFPAPIADGMMAMRIEAGPLPFEDAAFDSVVCLDVLEHVPAVERAALVTELARVAARRVLLACPSDEGAWIDALLRATYEARGIPAPTWLDEHDQHGLPTAAEIAQFSSAPDGFRARELTMPNGLLSTLAVVADMWPEFAERAAREWHEEHAGWLEVFKAGRFGSSHRKGWVIERIERRPALVDAHDLLGCALGALCCPGCGQTRVHANAGAPECDACGYKLGRDLSGALNLAAPSRGAADALLSADLPEPAEADSPAEASLETAEPPVECPASHELAPVRTAAPRRLLLSPDWEQPREWLPVLATYIACCPVDGSTALCLDASDDRVPLGVIHEMLALACEHVSGGLEFSQVLILDTPFVRDGLQPVRGVEQLIRAIGARVPVRTATDEEVADHAVAAKQLLDSIVGVLERWRYWIAPDPWNAREPLVSVRIATWGGTDLLVSRAIPSILNGSYGNVEVVVCSDGPGGAARAAIEGIGDERVRYLELLERPVYPEQPWSFWETAGSHAVNHALGHCRGSFIAPLDHDDAFTRDHIRGLLDAASSAGTDFVYGQAVMQQANGPWVVVGSEPLAHGHITHGSVLYSSRLAHMRLDPDSWLLSEPGDWNMWRRFQALGASPTFLPEVVFVHFQERTSIEGDGPHGASLERMVRTKREVASDLRRTGLDWLLEIPLGPAGAWREPSVATLGA
jgi:SAM-dependent methyltransferase